MLGFKPFKHSLNFHSRHWEKDIFLYNGMALNIFCPKMKIFKNVKIDTIRMDIKKRSV